MSESDYLNGWIFYSLGVAILVLVGWRITRGMTIVLRVPLLMILAAFLLTPFNIESGSSYMGPAWLIMLYEGVFVPEIGFARVGPALGLAVLVAGVVFPIFYGIYSFLTRGTSKKTKHHNDTSVTDTVDSPASKSSASTSSKRKEPTLAEV